MPARFPIFDGVLQGDFDAAGYTILNLDLTGLDLTKASVGLENVDNTSDANKPISAATITALSLKEPSIALGTSGQFWTGTKAWQTYGALALQGGATTLPELSSIGAGATGSAIIAAKRNDWASSFASVTIQQFGASSVGTVLAGVNNANAGLLGFTNTTVAVINTNNAVPLVFGTNSIKRAQILLGLNVGGDVDPGAGCISAFGTITGGVLAGTSGDISANLEVGGSFTVAGAILAGSTLATASNAAIAGNCVVSGFLTASGNVNFTGLPTSDPAVVGRLWRDSGVVKVSAG